MLFPIKDNDKWRGWLSVLFCDRWREEIWLFLFLFFFESALFTAGLWCHTRTVRCLSLAAFSLHGFAMLHHLLMSGLFSAEVSAVSSHRGLINSAFQNAQLFWRNKLEKVPTWISWVQSVLKIELCRLPTASFPVSFNSKPCSKF